MKSVAVFILAFLCLIAEGQDKRSAAFGADIVLNKGLFDVRSASGNFYFDIPDSLLGKEMLVVTRVTRGSIDNTGGFAFPVYPGDEISRVAIVFEKQGSKKILVRKVLFADYPKDSSGNLLISVERTVFRPIIAVLAVEEGSPMGKSVVNIMDLIVKSNYAFSFDNGSRNAYHLSAINTEASYLEQVQTFRENVEIDMVQSFTRSISDPGPPAQTFSDALSFGIHASFILLPKEPMRIRYQDARIGYFGFNQRQYQEGLTAIKTRSYITRWRLEPKPEDEARYLAGQTVEPQKPIIYYIDPAMPEKWVSYLIQGINDWQPAFEQAGFKNAIMGKRAPTDSTWSLYDARHSAIVYKPSQFKNAVGYSIADPRSGEILESHIDFYHNLVDLVQEQYFVACAAVDPAAREKELPDSLVGRLIRYAVSHEVGHALGLRHNMGASATVPVEKLRDADWLSEHAICPSVMDYARFNYVAQPEDRVQQKDLVARVAEYDRWAIEWGYKWYGPALSPETEKELLLAKATTRLRNPSLRFGSETSWDPRNNRNDLGDDPVRAGEYGIRNLKRMVPELMSWSLRPDQNSQLLFHRHDLVQEQLLLYLKTAATMIGGTYEDLKYGDVPGPVFEPVPKEKQLDALQFIRRYGLTEQRWLLDTALLLRSGQTAIGVSGYLNEITLSSLLNMPIKLYSMVSRNESILGFQTFTTLQFLDSLRSIVWKEFYTGEKIGLYRRNLQERYLKVSLRELMADDRGLRQGISIPFGNLNLYGIDGIEMMRGQLLDVRAQAIKMLPCVRDQATRYHFLYVIDQVDQFYNKTGKISK